MHYYSVFKDQPDFEAKLNLTARPRPCQLPSETALDEAFRRIRVVASGGRNLMRRELDVLGAGENLVCRASLRK